MCRRVMTLLASGESFSKIKKKKCSTDCDCLALLGPLRCPFTWGVAALPLDHCSYIRDKLFLAGTPWNALFERIRAAYSLVYLERHAEARTLIVDSYAILLPQLDAGCDFVSQLGPSSDFVSKYRPAFRYLLDATWAGMCIVSRKPCERPSPELKALLAAVTPFERLPRRQQAAVYAMNGRFAGEYGMAKFSRKAMAMDPDEGEWRHTLGWALQGNRSSSCPVRESDEEMKMLREAYRLRKDPNTLTRLAMSLAKCGNTAAQKAEARRLAHEAMLLFPDHPAVFTQAVNILPLAHEDQGSLTECLLAMVPLLKRTISLAGKSASARLRLGLMYQQLGMDKEYKDEVYKAYCINRSACEVFFMEIGRQPGNLKSITL